MSGSKVAPGGRVPSTLYFGDDRPWRQRARELEKENAELRASLARQLEISRQERMAREAAERSRDEALRSCFRARLPTLGAASMIAPLPTPC